MTFAACYHSGGPPPGRASLIGKNAKDPKCRAWPAEKAPCVNFDRIGHPRPRGAAGLAYLTPKGPAGTRAPTGSLNGAKNSRGSPWRLGRRGTMIFSSHIRDSLPNDHLLGFPRLVWPDVARTDTGEQCDTGAARPRHGKPRNDGFLTEKFSGNSGDVCSPHVDRGRRIAISLRDGGTPECGRHRQACRSVSERRGNIWGNLGNVRVAR